MSPSNRPDRTGLLVLPASVFVAATVFSVVLVWDAIELADGTFRRAQHRGTREQLLSEMTAALAQSLGIVPAVLLGLLVVGSAGVWLVRTARRYRELRARDAREWDGRK